jgi:hypothetical protein
MDGLWKLEERLWLEGAEAYAELVHPEAVMAFPGVGVLAGPAIARSLEGAPRWRSVEMSARRTAQPSPGVTVLAYRARGEREGAAPYEAWCTSTWVAGQLVQHQQTAA